jgi:acetylornithine deacetylase
MDTKRREEILQRIDGGKEEIIEFLQKLVSIPSVTGDELAIQEFIATKLKRMGLSVDMWDPDQEELKRHPAYVPVEGKYDKRPNVVGFYKGTGGGRSLLLNGHVDVIPPGPPTSWQYGPFAAEIHDNRLYGRGASDMKSGLAAMTMAMEFVLGADLRPRGDVILEYVMDEELSGNGTLACVLRGYSADAGICCETSSLHVQPACIGRVWWDITVRGKPAGIQRRFEGVNAIEKGYEIVKAVSNFEAIRIHQLSHPLYPDRLSSLPCMVGMFQAGTFPSAFPDVSNLKGSFATLPGEDTDKVKRDFVDHIRTFASTDPWLRDHPPEVKFFGYCGDSAEIAPDHPMVKALSRNFEAVTGKTPAVTGRQGAADIRYLIKYGKTPTVIFGPGATEQMHANNEWVDLDDVVIAIKTLTLTILEWCECQ